MAGYSTKPLAFKFSVPKGAEKNRDEQDATSDAVDKGDATGKVPNMDSEETGSDSGDSETSESEMGTAIGAAIKSGDGQAIYEAASKIISHCKG